MTNYPLNQQEKIRAMPAAVLLDAMLADPGNPIVSMREFMAGEKFISEANNKFPGNALIQDMSNNVNLPKLEEAVQHVFSIGDPKNMRTECQNKITNGLSALGQDREAEQFKKFLAALAEQVVGAAGEGMFGSKGSKISANEVTYIQHLKQQLGLPVNA